MTMTRMSGYGIGLVGLLLLVGLVGWATAVRATPAETETIIFYDGSLGTPPTEQGLLYASLFTGPTETLVDGGFVFNTLILPLGQLHQAGYAADPADIPTLDRTAGYTVTLALRVLDESHSSNDRAGFSLLVLSDDAAGTEPVKGLELAFWENEIWAQNDATQGGYFTHGEGVAFNTTTAVVTYDLHIITDTYRLSADGLPILNGPIRDYTGFEGTLDPYETPNILGFGDNTTSAGASVQVNYLAVTRPASPPEPEYTLYLPTVHN
jgi:hypothetical protein